MSGAVCRAADSEQATRPPSAAAAAALTEGGPHAGAAVLQGAGKPQKGGMSGRTRRDQLAACCVPFQLVKLHPRIAS